MDKTLIEGRPFILPSSWFSYTNGDIGEDHHQSNLGTVGGVTVFAQSILTNGVFIDPSSDTGPLSSFGAFCLTMQIDRRYQSCHGAFTYEALPFA